MRDNRVSRTAAGSLGSVMPFALLVAVLGCGGAGSSSSGPATGVYRGQSVAGNSVLGLVFANGGYYFLYTPPASPSLVSIVTTGSGAASNGNFSSSALLSVSMSFA